MEQRVIEIEKLTESEILGMVDDTVRLSWDEVLIFRQFTFHKQVYSVILRPDGELVSVKKSTKKLMTEFGKEMGICHLVLKTCWQVLNTKNAYPCTKGKFKLISTRGITCSETTWVMAHRVKSYDRCHDDGLLNIAFDSKVQVKLDVSKATFERRVRESRRCGTLQRQLFRQFELNYSFGNGDGKAGRYDDDDFYLKTGYAHLTNFGIRFAMNSYQEITKELFGQEIEEQKLRDATVKVLERTYMEK